MSHLRSAPARPRQAVGLAVAGTAVRAQGGPVEGVLVGHVEPQALRRLAGIADRPAPVIELAGDVLDQRLGSVHLDVLEHLGGETVLLGLIGSAVCRERVCKYMALLGDAVIP